LFIVVERECAICHDIKPLSQFRTLKKRPPHGRYRCIPCEREIRANSCRAWVSRNPDKRSKMESNWRKKNADKLREKWRKARAANKDRFRGYDLKRLYGITLDEYNAMHDRQGGVCAICKGDRTLKGRASGRLYVDHCHATSKVRGLLCSFCNSGLGYFTESVETLVAATEYLRASCP
jgi:hypothetical protein